LSHQKKAPLKTKKGSSFDTWFCGFIPGYFFGGLLILLALLLVGLEVARILTGSLNRRNGQYNLYPNNIYFPPCNYIKHLKYQLKLNLI
jgi:hypothetical protein